MPSTRSRNSLTPTSVHHADIMAKPASTVSAPTEMVAIDEDMPGIYDFIANAPSSTLAGSAPVPWIPAPLYIDEDFVASPVPSPPAAETSEAEFDMAFEEELANMPIPAFDYNIAYHSLLRGPVPLRCVLPSLAGQDHRSWVRPAGGLRAAGSVCPSSDFLGLFSRQVCCPFSRPCAASRTLPATLLSSSC